MTTSEEIRKQLNSTSDIAAASIINHLANKNELQKELLGDVAKK